MSKAKEKLCYVCSAPAVVSIKVIGREGVIHACTQHARDLIP